MKAILEFDLNDNDDREAHLRCVKSLEMAIVIWNIQQVIRGIDKHDYDLETVREKVLECMEDINIDEILS